MDCFKVLGTDNRYKRESLARMRKLFSENPDVRKHEVKVSTIMPGSVATHFGGNTPSEDEAWKIQSEDIAEMVMYLLHTPARTLPSKIEVRPSFPKSS